MNFVCLLATATGSTNNMSKVIITILVIVIIALLIKMKSNEDARTSNKVSTRNSERVNNDEVNSTYATSRNNLSSSNEVNQETISSKEDTIDPEILAAIIAAVKEDASQVIADEFKIVSIKEVK